MVGEREFEYDEQVAELVRRLVVGHTVTLDCLDVVWLDHLPLFVLYSDLAAIEVGQHEVDAGQRLQQGDLLLN